MAYKMIPVDEETYDKLLVLIEAYEMPKRSQGAMVTKLVNADTEKLAKLNLLPKSKKVVTSLPKTE